MLQWLIPGVKQERGADGRSVWKIQANAGGDALIVRRLYPLLAEAGYANVVVSTRMVSVDASRPALVGGYTRKTFNAIVAGVRD